MTPQDAIASLDAMLAENGADVMLRRVRPGGPVDVTVRAHVRGYTPRELTGSVVMGDTKAIISPTQITAAGWPGASTDGTDARVPVPNDRMIIAGRSRTVMGAAPFYMAGVLVRIELQLRG